MRASPDLRTIDHTLGASTSFLALLVEKDEFGKVGIGLGQVKRFWLACGLVELATAF